MRRIPGAIGLVVGAALGCAAPGIPVPVGGEVAALAGEWGGEYWSSESGRHGSIYFLLEAGADTAYGDVLMYPGRAPELEYAGTRFPPVRPSEALTITFVRARDGLVTGRLDPYRDPDCGCTLATTFEGRVVADTIRGTFSSLHQEMGKVVHGSWRAVRTRVPGVGDPSAPDPRR